MSEVEETKNRWIIGSLASLLLLPVIFIIGLVVGINIESSTSLSQDNLSSWVTAFSTVTIAVLTIVLAKETWGLRIIQLTQIEKIRKDSFKPNISLYLKPTPVSFNFIDVHISNTGSGTAQNINFTFKNASEDAEEVFEYLVGEINKLVIFEKGISSLSAGENRSSFLFNFIELHTKFGGKSLDCITEVDITYEDIEGDKYSSRSFFNFTEYKGISDLGGSDPVYKISSHLEKIQKDLAHITSGYRRIKSDVYTSEDRRSEREERDKRIDELKQQNEKNS